MDERRTPYYQGCLSWSLSHNSIHKLLLDTHIYNGAVTSFCYENLRGKRENTKQTVYMHRSLIAGFGCKWGNIFVT